MYIAHIKSCLFISNFDVWLLHKYLVHIDSYQTEFRDDPKQHELWMLKTLFITIFYQCLYCGDLQHVVPVMRRLTACGNSSCRHWPNSRPQAAPTRMLGMNRPLGMASPYVQQASRKNTTLYITRVTGLYVPGKQQVTWTVIAIQLQLELSL